ncbi:MAG: hypothetical protein ACAI44_29580 [Candidatus Sericytochromatia bacterium]
MSKLSRAFWQNRPTALVLAGCLLILGFGAGYSSPAQAQTCGVGTKVTLAWGSPVGTITKIGTESPYVGWYEVTFSYSPRGEWFPPTGAVLIEGTKTVCGQAPAQSQQPPKSNQPAAGQNAACPLVAPPGKVTSSAPASAALFKRVIYEWEAVRVNGTLTAPKQVGLTFLAFNMAKPYKNTLTAKRFGDKRLHTGAPPYTMLYPVKTRELVCDLHGDEIRRTVTEVDRTCFKSKSNTWVCPGRVTKYVESKLIPRN